MQDLELKKRSHASESWYDSSRHSERSQESHDASTIPLEGDPSRYALWMTFIDTSFRWHDNGSALKTVFSVSYKKSYPAKFIFFRYKKTTPSQKTAFKDFLLNYFPHPNALS